MSFVYLELLFTLTFVLQGGKGDIHFKECGQKRIGDEASSVWPWMVAIMKSDILGHYKLYGTGFLIDHRHVLTTAVIMQFWNIAEYQARIGNVDYTRGEIYRIVNMRKHPDFTVYLYNDIAMLTLDRPVTNPNFNPICLPNKEMKRFNLDNITATFVAWGESEQGEGRNILQQLRGMPVVSNIECQRIFQETNTQRSFLSQYRNAIDNRVMCAGFPEGTKYICGRAVGGPLMIERDDAWYAVGLLSFLHLCENREIPYGFTRVSAFSDWICENTWS